MSSLIQSIYENIESIPYMYKLELHYNRISIDIQNSKSALNHNSHVTFFPSKNLISIK